ncbi:MAG: E2 ligase fold family C protein [Porphyromonadaceae bacterium]|nr:E2 ligase fold family C protein [Porphyromonadaceae bacterium]
MALAKYFSKDLLAINRLVNTDHSVLLDRLNSAVISLAFDENCVKTFEGRCGVDIILRLISRLYPKLKLIDLSGANKERLEEYQSIAKRINSNIELVDSKTAEDVLVILGDSKKEITTEGLKIHFGSDNWIAKYSLESVQEFGDSNNPIGVGISACIVASNIFRHIFKDMLNNYDLDNSFELSTYSLDTNTKIENNPIIEDIELNNLVIAGIGAIGNGVIWTLSKIKNLKGNIHLVDDERISISNLQRYVLLEETNEDDIKVDVAKNYFTQKNLSVTPFKCNWDCYLNKLDDWNVNCVAVGIDNAKDRIGIQSTLPKIIFNAFTETESLAITRHKDFVNESCLSCSYIPLKKEKDFINEVADNCNIPQKAELVKAYYNLNLPVGIPIPNSNHDSLLLTIAKSNNIPIEELNQFNEMTLNQFYSDFVCGGIILNVSKTDKDIKNVDAPLAFQSAMAGILLSAELIKHTLCPDIIQEQRTDFYHLSPIYNGVNPYHRLIVKDETGRCICRDEDFINRYKEKWN